MKKIMIDMDDVICDGGFMELVNQFLGTNYELKDVKGYYVQDLIPKERHSEWAEFFRDKNVYDYATFLPNAYEVMEKLSKEYELYVTTAYIFRDNEYYSANNLKNKFIWLSDHLPFIPPQNYIFTTNKEIINCEIKIDDKLGNLSGNAELKLLFTAYHNEKLPDEELQKEKAIRVNGWKEIEKLLLK